MATRWRLNSLRHRTVRDGLSFRDGMFCDVRFSILSQILEDWGPFSFKGCLDSSAHRMRFRELLQEAMP